MALNFLQNLFSPGAGLDGSQVSAPAPNYGIELPQSVNSFNVGAMPNAAPPQPQAEAPRPRRSILDTVGRLADVFAKVGGADALYQPTLDAREDRTLAIGDHAQNSQLKDLQIQQGHDTITDEGRKRVQLAVKGAQAILAANPKADLAAIFPTLAQRVGIPADEAQGLGAELAANPSLLTGLGGTDDKDAKYSGSVVLSRGPDGKIHAFQPSLGDEAARDILPDGFTGNDPALAVNTGDKTNIIGKNSGEVQSVIENGVKPDTTVNAASREKIAAGNNRTAITVAGMPARGKAGGTGKDAPASRPKQAADLLDELDRNYTALDKAGGAVKPGAGAINNVLARVRSSGVGQMAEGAIGTEAQTYRDRIGSIRPALMQSLAKATGMTGKQLDSNADVKLFMQTVTDPTKSLPANRAAIAGLRRFLADNAKPDAAPAATRKLPPRIGGGGKPAPRVGKPTVSNWN